MKRSTRDKQPVPSFPRRKPRHEPLLREEEQYPTFRYNSPPVPPWMTLVPPGMVGYQEMKREMTLEAKRDRASHPPPDQEEAKRWAFITKLAVRFPQVGVQRIAQEVVPWDVEEFKRRVVEAQTRFYENIGN